MASRTPSAQKPHAPSRPAAKRLRRSKAAPTGNVVHLEAWTPPDPFEAEHASLECACDVVAVDWAMGFELAAAVHDYQRDLLTLGLDSLDVLRTTLDHAVAEGEAEEVLCLDATKVLGEVERYCAINLRFFQRLCDASLSAMTGLAALPTHFTGKT